MSSTIDEKSIGKESISNLPEHFMRSENEMPEHSQAIEGIQVLIISLSQPNKDVLVHELSKACNEWGIFALTDHGIPQSLLDQLRYVGEEKHASNPSSGNFEGYATRMVRNYGEKIEWVDYYFHLMYPPCKVNHQAWPEHPPSYRYIHVLSKEKCKSVLRRSSVNKERSRMSWAEFSTPPHDAVIGPLESLVNDENPSKHSSKTFAEYRYRKISRLPQ
ncbi:hypothetical protein MKX01_035247 [Papaver californicum]|nr:hypothetical protein MKX01_035247 [Papaver californicum]